MYCLNKLTNYILSYKINKHARSLCNMNTNININMNMIININMNIILYKKVHNSHIYFNNNKYITYSWTYPYRIEIHTKYKNYEIIEELNRNLWNNDIIIYKNKILIDKKFAKSNFYLKINEDLKFKLSDQIYEVNYFYQYINEQNHLSRIGIWFETNKKINTSTVVYKKRNDLYNKEIVIDGTISFIDLYQKNGEITNINSTLTSGAKMLYDLNDG